MEEGSIQLLPRHSGMEIIDRLSNPDRELQLRCQEISPYTHVRVIGDSNCLFSAFSRHLTGMEDNHEAVHQTIVAYLFLHPDLIATERGAIDRAVPTDDLQRYHFWRQHVDRYLAERACDLSTGRWGTHLVIHVLADMLDINILIFTTDQTGLRLWVQFAPRLGVTRVGQYAFYIYHTTFLNQYDCVFPSKSCDLPLPGLCLYCCLLRRVHTEMKPDNQGQ